MKKPSLPRWAAAGAALILTLAALVLGLLERRMVDFEVNDRAARRIPLGETLYRSEDGHFQFKYPPAAALMYLPLTVLPPEGAKAAWFFLSLLAIGFCLELSMRLAGWADGPQSWAARVLSLLILGKFFLRELELGQVNIFILLFMLFSARFLARAEDEGRARFESAAGLLWGVATAVKPYTLVFLPYFLVRRKPRALAAGVAVLAASFLLPGLFYGMSGNWIVIREWVVGLTASTPPLLTSQDNVSVFACAAKHLAGSAASAVGWAAAALLGLFTLWIILKGRSRSEARPDSRFLALEVAILLLLTPLVSPLGWDYTLLAGLPAVVIALRHFGRFQSAGRVLLAASLAWTALFLYDIFGREAYGVLMGLCLPTANALVLAGFLADLRRRGIC
ncbi:MAG: DUF2029 domain-containing protein [Candidatus Aminicenantes bacterium]|nr:DUF2029 domain-containing protein [Candidatus Aminicenantes bacterium]